MLTCGNGEYGRLGNGGSSDHPVPEPVEFFDEKCVRVWTDECRDKQRVVDFGAMHDLSIRANLSSSTHAYTCSTDIVQIASGHAFNLVLTKEGKVFTWGRNEQGQVGLPPVLHSF